MQLFITKMTTSRSYRKFSPDQKKIDELEKNSPRFKRVYSEYEMMSEELWDIENTGDSNVPEDFVDAIILQTAFLEDEIDHWLLETPTVL